MDDSDPKPIPPEKLLPGDCCDSGCTRCVRDVYMDQRDRYRKALTAWKQRHPEPSIAESGGSDGGAVQQPEHSAAGS